MDTFELEYGHVQRSMRHLHHSIFRGKETFPWTKSASRDIRTYVSSHNLIQIQNGCFYREHPSSTVGSETTANPVYFPNLNFSLPATSLPDVGEPSRRTQHWAVIGANDTTTFLDILRGNLLCIPPTARTYPYLSSSEIAHKDSRLRIPSHAIQYVGFNSKRNSLSGSSSVQGAYLSARYESRREETDWTVLQYLKGDTELNPDTRLSNALRDDDALLQQVVRDLRLQKLVSMPVSNLSNGQTRRARIAKALLSRPELLLLDEPFMGLDPPTLVSLSPMLRELAWRSSPLLLLALRPQDPIPDWISHLVILGSKRKVVLMGEKEQVLFSLQRWADLHNQFQISHQSGRESEKRWLKSLLVAHGDPLSGVGDSLTEKGVRSYNTYDMFKADRSSFLNEDGISIKPSTLDEHQQKLWQDSKNKPALERTAEDWWTLMTSLPTSFEDKNTGSLKVGSLLKASMPSSSTPTATSSPALGEPLIEIQSITLRYGDKIILGHPPPQPGFTEPGLNLTIRRSTRLALLGPNGSGKTTLLSLLTSDHPQSYSLPIKFFGRERLPSPGKPGLSLWEIQSRIGHSSPEVHAFFPKTTSIRRVLESSWAETFKSRPELNEQRSRKVDRVLKWWEDELRQDKISLTSDKVEEDTANEQDVYPLNEGSDLTWADDKTNHTFGTLPFGTQRLLLLLRAFIKEPDILVLDEAFSGLSAQSRDKAMLFLEHGETYFMRRGQKIKNTPRRDDADLIQGLTQQQAMVVVSHIREEIPPSVNEWLRLPSEEEASELGKGVMMGTVEGGDGIRGLDEWNRIWGL